MQIGNLRLPAPGAPSAKVMGVLNLTPDSFSDGGELWHSDPARRRDLALRRAEQMCAEGAALLDVGGESTRPGAAEVSLAEEADRVLDVVAALKERLDLPLSVDTSKPEIMTAAAEAGADMINDVRALTAPGALEAAARTGLPVCLVHIQGTPQDMQNNPHYGEVVGEVRHWLAERMAAAEAAGIAPDRLLLDPGFGFGKTLQHNLTLLSRLRELHQLGRPLLVGLSRKSMLGTLTGRPPAERLPAGIAATLQAVSQGAAIVRTHDVAATTDALRVWQAVHAA